MLWGLGLKILIDNRPIRAARAFWTRYSQVNWALVDQAFVSGCNFLTGILLARYLGIEEFGSYVLAWIFVDCLAAIALAGFIQIVADPETGRMMIEPPPRNVTALIMAVSFPFFIVISVKRLHDLNASGLFAIVLLFPPASLVATILLGIIPGKPGPNRFGEAADVLPEPAAGD